MNVKSKFDTGEESTPDQRDHYLRGGCGTPYSMISGPTRIDVSSLHAPKFLRKIFELMGWKTEMEPKD